MLPKAIFLDLDDTIVSYHLLCEPAWSRVCEDFAQSYGILDGKTLYSAINETARHYWSDPERHRQGRLNLDGTRREIVMQAFRKLDCLDGDNAFMLADNYSNLHQEMIHMFPDAEETIKELVSRGIKLALITNGNSVKQRYKINKFGLEKYFDACLVEGEVGFGKPDPRVFRLAMEKLQVTPEEVWMVGDNLEWDIEAPQKLGIYSIWNDYSRKGLPADSKIVPDRIINNIRELL